MIKNKKIIMKMRTILLNHKKRKNLKGNFILWMLKIKFLGDKKKKFRKIINEKIK